MLCSVLVYHDNKAYFLSTLNARLAHGFVLLSYDDRRRRASPLAGLCMLRSLYFREEMQHMKVCQSRIAVVERCISFANLSIWG